MNLLGKACEGSFWKEVREKDCFAPFRNEIITTWSTSCEGKEIPELRYSDFLIFTKTGSRSEYEQVYFDRRRRMNACSFLSLIYPEEEKYFTYLCDILFAICNEFSWCLPAHYGDASVDNHRAIDLFAAETGFALSEIYTMLKDRLDPLLSHRIRSEIDRRIIEPYQMRLQTYGWETANSNWTAVCTGSIGCTVMLMRPALFDALHPRFQASMECYLEGFASDGFCVEGCGYWHYGFGYFLVYADMVKIFTDGKEDYFVRDKIRAIATYLQKMFLSGHAAISFADSGRILHYHLGMLHYLKKRYPEDVVIYDRKYAYHSDNCARYCLHLRAALWYCEEFETTEAPTEAFEFFAEGAEWYIKKTASYGFAAKGGHNQEPHNHNDVGSFIFAKNGTHILTDPGSGGYSKQYFGKERYTFFHTASFGHSLPIIGDHYQQCGRKFAARNCTVAPGSFRLDIADAYGLPELTSLERSFTLEEDSVTVTDCFHYTGNEPIRERLVTSYVPEKTADGFFISGCLLTYDRDSVADVKITKQELPGSAPYYTIDFTLASDVTRFSYCIGSPL